MLGNAYRLVDHMFLKSCKDTTGNDPFGALERRCITKKRP